MTQISLKNLLNNSAPGYPVEVAQPFRDELTDMNFKEMLTPSEVDAALNKQDDKIALVVLNSVCGCAARAARPGVVLSMLNVLVPDEYLTLFAGMEKEAVEHFRIKYLQGITPSSPNIALFKNGKLLHILQRYQIEGKTAGQIAGELTGMYDSICSKKNSQDEINTLKKQIADRYQVSIGSLNL